MPLAADKIVFVDVDTQIDFMLPEGKLYVPGAEKLIPNLERLMRFAREHGIPVISSVDAHTPDDPEFQHFPAHCVKGTPGQAKIPETLLPQRIVVPNEKQSLPEPPELSRCQQWILEKQTFDMFENVNAAALFEKIAAGQYIAFGVATEYCVRADVLSVLRLGRPVWLVTDAIRPIDAAGGEAALREMQEAGVRLLTTQDAMAQMAA
jgi:nicotinamidase/pyrazinamidase